MQPPVPLQAKVLAPNGLASQEWAGYFTERQARNAKQWEPVFVSLGGGDFEATGYWTVTERIFVFSLLITPVASIVSTLGATYFELPYSSLADGAALAFNTASKSPLGAAYISGNRVYLPSFTVSDPVSASGTVQIGASNG